MVHNHVIFSKAGQIGNGKRPSRQLALYRQCARWAERHALPGEPPTRELVPMRRSEAKARISFVGLYGSDERLTSKEKTHGVEQAAEEVEKSRRKREAERGRG